MEPPDDPSEALTPETVGHCVAVVAQHHDYAGAADTTARPARGLQEPLTEDEQGLAALLSHVHLVDERELLASYSAAHKLEQCESALLERVLLGCVRWRKLLHATLAAFFTHTGCRYLRADYALFAVLFYVVLFESAAAGPTRVAAVLTRALDAHKAFRLVRFLLDGDADGSLERVWQQRVDAAFVTERLLPALRSQHDMLQRVLATLQKRVERGETVLRSRKALTEPQPFLLTKPHPRRLPEPERACALVHRAKPAPGNMSGPSLDAVKLAQVATANRQRAVAAQAEAAQQLFQVAQRPRLTEKTLQRLETLRVETRLRTNTFRAKPIMRRARPASSSADAAAAQSVKLTTAAVLREDAVLRRKAEQRERELSGMEMGLGDASAYERWRLELEAQDDEQKRVDMQRKWLQIQLTHEETAIARKRLEQQNLAKGAAVKLESARGRARIGSAQKQLQAANLKKIDSVHRMRDHARDVRRQLLDENKERAAQLALEADARQREAREAAQRDLESRMQLIREIREAERAVRPAGGAARTLDPTETSDSGLLTEMSVLELQERLVMLRSQQAELEAQRRDAIRATRRSKQRLLEEKVAAIHAHRRAQVSSVTGSGKREREASAVEVSTDPAAAARRLAARRELDALHERLLQRRQMRAVLTVGRPSVGSAAPSASVESVEDPCDSSVSIAPTAFALVLDV